MDNELMYETVEETLNEDVVVNEGSGIGLGKLIAIGAGVVAAGVGAYKLGKKAWNKHKAKKEEKIEGKYAVIHVEDKKEEDIEEVAK